MNYEVDILFALIKWRRIIPFMALASEAVVVKEE